MEDDARRGPPLLAYAALMCGGVFACLLLLAGPARADAADPDGGRAQQLLPLAQAGERVAATTREIGRGTSDVVRRATAPAARLAPVGEDAAERVVEATDRVADGVGRVAQRVDRVVDEPALPLPDSPTAEEPDTDVPEPAAPRPTDQRDRTDRPLRATATPDDVRTAPERERTHRRVQAHTVRGARVAAPAPAPHTLTVSTPAGARAPAAVPEPAPRLLVAGCDECAATGTSSGDPLLVLGLPTQGVTTPRLADSVPRDAVVGGPVTVFRRPVVSPD